MIEFTVEQVRELGGPGVYIFSRGRTVVYVGATLYGLGRTFSPNHQMRKYSDLKVKFIPMATGKEAFEEEERLILQFDPEYNVGAPYGKEQRRRYQARHRAIRKGDREIERLQEIQRNHPKLERIMGCEIVDYLIE